MADLDITSNQGMVDKRVGRGRTATGSQFTSFADRSSVASMKARLNTINATSYTADRMNKMTKNDLEYAIRLNDDAAGM